MGAWGKLGEALGEAAEWAGGGEQRGFVLHLGTKCTILSPGSCVPRPPFFPQQWLYDN